MNIVKLAAKAVAVGVLSAAGEWAAKKYVIPFLESKAAGAWPREDEG